MWTVLQAGDELVLLRERGAIANLPPRCRHVLCMRCLGMPGPVAKEGN
jgi:hypothetical protein